MRRFESAYEPVRQLRAAVAALPVSTAAAMLEGTRSFPIIAGRFVEPGCGAGVCLAVAANRAGNPNNPMNIDVAWDRFCGVRSGEVRRATAAEVRYVARLLELRVFPAAEREGSRTCAGCSRRFIADWYGDCVFCGEEDGGRSVRVDERLVCAFADELAAVLADIGAGHMSAV